MPSMEVFSQVLGSLKLPHDVSFRNRLVENLGVSSEAFRRFNIFSLLDGFGEYDPRSFSLFEVCGKKLLFLISTIIRT